MVRRNGGLSAEQIIEAVRKSKGILTLTAKELGVSRQTVHTYVNKYPTIKAAVESEREALLDMAEGSLFDQVRKGNITAIIFTLKTLGKHRGYVERQELAGVRDQEIFVRILDDKNDSKD